MFFLDRADAGRRLAEKLRPAKAANPVVVGLMRGGVAVAAEVAAALGAPLDIMIVRKIGAPGQPEFALGAVVDGGRRVLTINRSFVQMMNISRDFLRQAVDDKLQEIDEMRHALNRPGHELCLTGRTVIAVDDGMATGASMQAVVKRIRKENPKSIIAAAPVASKSAVELLRGEAEEIIVLETPEPFFAVGQFFLDFSPVTTDAVAEILRKSNQQQFKKAV